MIELSIIIVNYNTHTFVRDCLNSINRFICNIRYETIVVDNNSTDRGIECLRNEFDDVTFIFEEKNNGFGAGCNIGVQHSEGEFLLFLNPDIEIKTESVNLLFEYIKENSSVGLVSGLLRNREEKLLYSYNSFPDIVWEFREAFGILLRYKIRKLLEKNEIKTRTPFEVDWFHGACMCTRRDVFNQVGGFDENIFLYYEDTDFQRRIRDKGYKIICIPAADFYHHERSSIQGIDANLQYYRNMHISKMYYYGKYNMKFKLFIIRILFISGSIFKVMTLLLRPYKWKYINIRVKQYFKIIELYLKYKII